MHLRKRLGVMLAATMLVALTVAPGIALADDVTHGIGLTKGCTSPTKIGDPYACSYSIRNNLDDAHDTLTINSLVDTVHAAGGDVTSGNILGSAQIAVLGGATCVAAAGSGTLLDPYTGVTSCTLPFDSRVNVLSFTHYTVQAADFALPNHQLRDDVSLGWHDLCNDPAGTGDQNCNANPPNVGAASLSLITALSTTTATAIHNAAHQTVTTVPAGSVVHDFVTVTGQPGAPVPTGNVTIDWFLNGTCTAPAAANSGPIALGADGTVDATGFHFTSAGSGSFQATYLGDATYTGSTGACEPLGVVDANIQITPATATNPVGTTHVLTLHVNVDPGTGFVNAPAGTSITASIQSGPGSFVGSPTCTTVGTTGSCTVTITSPTTGTTVVRGTTTVDVGGVSLTRTTGDTNVGDSADANKTWANAAITITPSATNAVGQPHTFTVTVLNDTGSGLQPVGAGEQCNVTLTNANGAVASPAGPFNLTTNASGQCSVTFTSATAGTVTGHASSMLSVGGASFTVQTDGTSPNSGDAVKTFVNANIQITPATATNPVGTTHVLTITVNAINGTLAAGTATASIVSGPGSFVGSPTCSYAGGGSTASCTVTITSFAAGTTVVSATSDISVGGQSITRTTNTAVNTAAGGSGNAQKTWESLASGRVTGGGSIFATVNGVPNVRVTHGFELRCDPNDPRQSLEINWDGGNNFHLDKIINSVVCFDDPTTQPPPPPGTVIDTYAGDTLFNGSAGYHGFGYAVGTGTCNKEPATIYFILIDAGEPGTADTAEYHIVSSGCTLDAGPAQLLKGNHQFHKN